MTHDACHEYPAAKTNGVLKSQLPPFPGNDWKFCWQCRFNQSTSCSFGTPFMFAICYGWCASCRIAICDKDCPMFLVRSPWQGQQWSCCDAALWRVKILGGEHVWALHNGHTRIYTWQTDTLSRTHTHTHTDTHTDRHTHTHTHMRIRCETTTSKMHGLFTTCTCWCLLTVDKSILLQRDAAWSLVWGARFFVKVFVAARMIWENLPSSEP